MIWSLPAPAPVPELVAPEVVMMVVVVMLAVVVMAVAVVAAASESGRSAPRKAQLARPERKRGRPP
jgi:hypothetical protein